MGPSGSGKSTLMHILAGLDTPTSGWVEIDGTRLDDLDDRHLTLHRRREVGFIFQSYNLLPVLSAEQNEGGGQVAAITSLENAGAALEGEAGTIVRPAPEPAAR